jgi:hypothetical protein
VLKISWFEKEKENIHCSMKKEKVGLIISIHLSIYLVIKKKKSELKLISFESHNYLYIILAPFTQVDSEFLFVTTSKWRVNHAQPKK